MRYLKPMTSAIACSALIPRGIYALAAQETSPQMPDAPGKAVVLKICTTCHDIESVISSRRTKIGWQQNVEDMIGKGAEGSENETNAVIEYLAKYFGKVNVNTASADEMVKTVGLSEDSAKAIAEYRERHGKIKDFEELRKVPGVRAEELSAKRGLIAFSL
jgi:competence ComEA-like helix-hairpin-helix protein